MTATKRLTPNGLALKVLFGLSSLLLLLSLNTTAEEYYRWTDADGNLHYTDKPPMGKKAEKLTATHKTPETLDEAESNTAPSLKNKELCKKEKTRLNTLQNSPRIQMIDQDGSKRYLSTDEIQQEIKKSQKAIATFCG